MFLFQSQSAIEENVEKKKEESVEKSIKEITSKIEDKTLFLGDKNKVKGIEFGTVASNSIGTIIEAFKLSKKLLSSEDKKLNNQQFRKLLKMTEKIGKLNPKKQ